MNRWKKPQPVIPWDGIRKAESFSPACLNGNRPAGQPGAILYQGPLTQSEDCLYLNVWTGKDTATKKPVMVLLHGGGYQLGAGSQPNYNGKGLAAKGAIVVTMNYRLGPLGFLAHPELTSESDDKSSGNYALHDAVAVLKWVQSNIDKFGGDSSNVTVYSESAGAGIASVLYASPMATGLFHKLAIESLAALPATAPNTTLVQAETAGKIFQSNLKAQDLAGMRAAAAGDVMAAAGAVVGPIVDGKLLPDQLDLLIAAGKVNAVPLLTGWNADEGTPYPPFATTLAAYQTKAATYGAFTNAFQTAYPAASDEDVMAMRFSPFRDANFAWQVWTLARANAALNKSATYLYYFTRRPSYNPGQSFTGLTNPVDFGAYHSLEQVYFYNNLEVSSPTRAYTDVDRNLADVSSNYLVNFAKNGDPNGANLPVWPKFTGPSSQTMELGNSIGPVAVPSRAALDFLDVYNSSNLGRKLPF